MFKNLLLGLCSFASSILDAMAEQPRWFFCILRFKSGVDKLYHALKQSALCHSGSLLKILKHFGLGVGRADENGFVFGDFHVT